MINRTDLAMAWLRDFARHNDAVSEGKHAAALLAEVERLERERDRVIEQCRSDHADWTKMAIAEWSQTYDALRAERDAAQRALAEMTTQRDAYRETNASIALQRESPEMASQLVVAQRALAATATERDMLADQVTKTGGELLRIERTLTAAQADNARLRAALQRLADDDMPVNVQNFARHALAAPAGDEALRELLRRACDRLNGAVESTEETIDAVLRGER